METNDSPPATPQTLTAIGTGRQISFFGEPGDLVLVCFAPSSKDQALGIGASIKERRKDGTLAVAHLIDLSKLSRVFRKPAEMALGSEFEKAARALPEGMLPYEAIVILPDWEGEAVRSLGLEDVSGRPAVVVIRDGRVLGIDQSDELATAAILLLDN